MHQNPNYWIWYSWIIWWPYEFELDIETLIVGPLVGGLSVEPWYLVWSPWFDGGHHETLILDTWHLWTKLVWPFGLVIDWNPNSLECGSWPPCHASSIIKFALILRIISQVDHLTYMSTWLRLLLIQSFHSCHVNSILSFIAYWS